MSESRVLRREIAKNKVSVQLSVGRSTGRSLLDSMEPEVLLLVRRLLFQQTCETEYVKM